MKNTTAIKTAKNEKTPINSMIGKCFVRIGDDGFWNNQGIIRGEPMP